MQKNNFKKIVLTCLLLYFVTTVSVVRAYTFYQDGAEINTILKTACYEGGTGINVLGRRSISCVKLTDKEVEEAVYVYEYKKHLQERAIAEFQKHQPERIKTFIFFLCLVGGFILLVWAPIFIKAAWNKKGDS
jgi:hypothetical protein